MQNAFLKRLASSFNTIGQSITIADALQPDMPIIYVNKGFEKFSGYTREEVIGRNCRFLQQTSLSKLGGSVQDSVQVIRDAIAANAPCMVDLMNYKKDGSRLFNRLSLRPTFDMSGNLRYYIGIQTDITVLTDIADEIFKHLTDALKSNGGKGATQSA